MKETTKMSRAVSQLEHIYNALNTDFFDGLLPVPIITVQSKPGTYGHCTTAKVWQRKDGGAYELNIAAEVLNYPIEETLDTMLHEMVHLYCRDQRGQPGREVPQRKIQSGCRSPRLDLHPMRTIRLEYHTGRKPR